MEFQSCSYSRVRSSLCQNRVFNDLSFFMLYLVVFIITLADKVFGFIWMDHILHRGRFIYMNGVVIIVP